jgi:hypothetical protein
MRAVSRVHPATRPRRRSQRSPPERRPTRRAGGTQSPQVPAQRDGYVSGGRPTATIPTDNTAQRDLRQRWVSTAVAGRTTRRRPRGGPTDASDRCLLRDQSASIRVGTARAIRIRVARVSLSAPGRSDRFNRRGRTEFIHCVFRPFDVDRYQPVRRHSLITEPTADCLRSAWTGRAAPGPCRRLDLVCRVCGRALTTNDGLVSGLPVWQRGVAGESSPVAVSAPALRVTCRSARPADLSQCWTGRHPMFRAAWS